MVLTGRPAVSEMDRVTQQNAAGAGVRCRGRCAGGPGEPPENGRLGVPSYFKTTNTVSSRSVYGEAAPAPVTARTRAAVTGQDENWETF